MIFNINSTCGHTGSLLVNTKRERDLGRHCEREREREREIERARETKRQRERDRDRDTERE